MSKSFVRSALTSLVLCGVLGLLPAPAETQRDTSSADARLRALYTEEWNWRRQEMARISDQPGEAGAAIGSVPLPVLEQRMADFVANGGVNPPTAPQRNL